MMDCPLGLDKVHCSSCCFWRDKCHCDPLPKSLARFLVAGDKLLAWPRGREWVKGLDNSTLGVLEQALFLKIKETGLGDILAALLGTVMWESLCRQFLGQSMRMGKAPG